MKHEASRLRAEDLAWRFQDGAIAFDVILPPLAVAAITLEFAGRDGG